MCIEPQSIENPLRDTSMSKWIESLDYCLLKFWEVNKPHLAYVAISQVAVKPHATDPATDYESFDQ